MTPIVETLPEPDGVVGAVRYRAVDEHGAPIPGPTVAVIAVMHGNEPVGLGVHDRIAQEVTKELIAGEVLCVKANLEAARLDQRHTEDGRDMNRLWDPENLVRIRRTDPAQLCYEERRVHEVAPLLLQADAVLDLHSTSRPSAPFLVFRDDQRHAQLARRMGVAHLVTGLHENAILSGGAGANVGLGPGEHGPRVGLTFEAGQHTDPGNAERAFRVAWRLFHEMGVWKSDPPPSRCVPEVYEVTDRFVQTSGTPWRFVGYAGGEPGGGRRGPLRQLHSFERVEADEVLLKRGAHDVVRAQFPFTMLMPAPTTPAGTDLYYITEPRHGGLTQGSARSDEEARAEALAIERMLDLLADDDFVTGTSWVAFDSRRLFDLCASVVGRNLRLPEGHPHRRLLVMGRGDAPTDDDSHRRDTVRYRRAMQLAMREGIPVERVQLLRGASLSWLDALTSPAMAQLLGERRERLGHDDGDVRMRISLRQPHTASMLVAGDIGLALTTGDTRHVRVALLVEAATVEPDGPGVRVRVMRTGLVSARPEVLLAAKRLIDALQNEHAYDVTHGALRDAPAVQALLCPDGSLRSVPDPEALAGLRSALYRVQLGLWCDQLRYELKEPVPLPDEASLGRWLADTMATTGILDADGLHALAVRRRGSGWVADPAAVASLENRLRQNEADMPQVLFGPTVTNTPRQPFRASDVTADDLERWVGWKRFVRGVRSVPDTRGMDFDIAFSGADIRRRLCHWYGDALRLARQEGQEVLVVLAGDGLSPDRDVRPSGDATPLAARRRGDMSERWPGDDVYAAHDALLREPGLHYLRIQHAQGTYLSWMKDFVRALGERPAHGRPVALQWEVEHGDTVSIVLLATRDEPASLEGHGTLEGWNVVRCAVVLSDLNASGEDYEIGLFTQSGASTGSNQELLAFGRAHCSGLLAQKGARVACDAGMPDIEAVETVVVAQIARWIQRVRRWRRRSSTVPDDLQERARWVAHRLGLADRQLARALAMEMAHDRDPMESAWAVWAGVGPWPGAPAGPSGTSDETASNPPRPANDTGTRGMDPRQV